MMKIYTLLALSVLSVQSMAAEFHFDQSASELNFQGSYDGEPIDGKFEKFSGTVRLEWAKPSDARFLVSIDVNSLNTDYAERDDTLKSEDWFNSEKYPLASFESTSACVLAPASPEVAAAMTCPGNLKIRGQSKAVSLAIRFDSASQTMTGKSTINRRDFGIGQGEWEEAGVIGETVSIGFRLTLGAK
jgi:polyisoprenoid-binding protein YceI